MLKRHSSRLFLLWLFFLALVVPIGVKTNSRTFNGSLGSFVAYGDTRTYHDIHQQVVDRLLQYNPEFVINTGDLIETGGSEADWEIYEQITANITVPIYSCIGNHEKHEDEDFSNYFKYTGCESYYSFNWKRIHFICLNTEEVWIEWNGTFAPTEEQMAWLTEDLSNNTDRTVIAFFHRPMFSPNPGRAPHAESTRAAFLDLFIQFDVDLVLNGHDHYYYRTYRNGTYYVVTGGGGAPLYTPNDPDGTLMLAEDVAISVNHFCNFVVNDSHMSVTMIMKNGTSGDSFTIPLEGSSISSPASDSSSKSELGFLPAIAGLLMIRKIGFRKGNRPKR